MSMFHNAACKGRGINPKCESIILVCVDPAKINNIAYTKQKNVKNTDDSGFNGTKLNLY
jgi:hypothetical protein